MVDHVFLGFELAERYRTPAMILADGALGQMMEKVTLPPRGSAAARGAGVGDHRQAEATGRGTSSGRSSSSRSGWRSRTCSSRRSTGGSGRPSRAASCSSTEDAEIVLVAFGLAARICQKAMDLAREKGIRVGLLRPMTLFPFPTEAVARARARRREDLPDAWS